MVGLFYRLDYKDHVTKHSRLVVDHVTITA